MGVFAFPFCECEQRLFSGRSGEDGRGGRTGLDTAILGEDESYFTIRIIIHFCQGWFCIAFSVCKEGGDMERMGDSRFLLYVCRSFDGIRGR